MPLFDVPGWTVDAPSIVEATSKKRKRSAVEPHDLQAAEANFEKLVKQLERSSSNNLGSTPKKKEKKEKRKRVGTAVNNSDTADKGFRTNVKDVVETSASPAQPPPKTLDKSHPFSTSVKKKKSHGRDSLSSKSAVVGLTPLQRGMKESLDGARFR